MRVLVTGHKGYIGTVLVPMLQSVGHEVAGLDCDLYRHCSYADLAQSLPEVIKDVRDVEKPDLEDVDAIVHLAALSNDPLGELNPEITFEINHRASLRLAEMAKGLGIQRFVFASSCSNYGAADDSMKDESASLQPVTAYAESKVLAERDLTAMASSDFSPTFLRNATAYGVSPRIRLDVVVNNLTACACTTGKVFMTSDGNAWRPLVHVEDISLAVIATLAAPRDVIHDQAFNVGQNDENYRIRDLAEHVRELVPDCEITFADGAGTDRRNYRVDCSKYADSFPAFPLQWRARAGVEDIYRSFQLSGLGLDEFQGPKYKRMDQLKVLLSRGDVDETLRWTRDSVRGKAGGPGP